MLYRRSLRNKYDQQRLAASVRADSMDKPQVSKLRDIGVEIRAFDWQTARPSELDKHFEGVETVISTCYYSKPAILGQKALVDAAKRSGIKRFIPCDFGTPAPPGIMDLRDNVSSSRSQMRVQVLTITKRKSSSTST